MVLSTQEGSKIKIHDSWYLYQENRPTPPSNLAHFKTNHDGLVLPPNFDNIFFIAFVVLSNQEGSKTARSKIMIFGTYVGFTDPHHHQTWLTWIPTKMDWFCQQTLPTSFFAFVVLSTQKGKKNKKKTTRSTFHDFWQPCQASLPTPPPNLAHFKTNQDGLVLPPNFVNLIFIAFLVFSNQDDSKTMRSKIHDS